MTSRFMRLGRGKGADFLAASLIFPDSNSKTGHHLLIVFKNHKGIY